MAIGLIVLLGGIGILVGGSKLRLSEDSAYAVPWLVLLPAGTAAVTSMSLDSRMRTAERLASRRMSVVIATHLLALLALSLVASAVNLVGIDGPYSFMAAARNVAGFTGIALLGSQLSGYRLSWIWPLGWAFCCVSFGLHEGVPSRWALAILPDSNLFAAVVSLLLLAVGLSVVLQPRWIPFYYRRATDDAS
jgi:hypothetical protein